MRSCARACTTLGALSCYNSGDMDEKGLKYAKKVMNRYEFVLRSKVFEKNHLRIQSKKALSKVAINLPTFDKSELVNDMLKALKSKQLKSEKRSGIRVYE